MAQHLDEVVIRFESQVEALRSELRALKRSQDHPPAPGHPADKDQAPANDANWVISIINILPASSSAVMVPLVQSLLSNSFAGAHPNHV